VPRALTNGRSPLSKTRRDFSEADVAVTRRIQPLLPVVARQHDVLPGQGPGGNGGADAARVVANFGLTARDTAVLQLLTEGLTAGATGSRLAAACSASTPSAHRLSRRVQTGHHPLPMPCSRN
jgi:hypothetical protein